MILNIDATFITIVMIIVVIVMIGPAITLAIIGKNYSIKENKDKAKTYYVLAVVYLLISFGTCGGLIYG